MNEFDKINEKKNVIYNGINNEKQSKQHSKGKLTAKERIDLLMDEGTFLETNAFVEHECSYFGMENKRREGDGVITGYGKVNGRTVCVYAQDFTVFGGTISEANARKISSIQKYALKRKVPIIGLFDSGGARIQEGIRSLSGHGHLFYNNVEASGIIPQISAIMGPCAGGASYSPALTDFVYMVENTSAMFITGPGVVKEMTGQEISTRELGGTVIHTQLSGVAQFLCSNDRHCIEGIKLLLSYLPDNYQSLPITRKYKKIGNEYREKLNEIIPKNPRRPYDVKLIIEELLDKKSFYEVSALFAKNIVVGFGTIQGKVVGIVANQPMVLAGCLDVDASDKASRFIRICDCFNIPLINLVDVPGFMPGKDQEYKGIIRHGAKMLYAYGESQVLKITILLRKAYGGSYLAMCSKEMGADFVFAWNSAELAVMGPEGAAEILYKKEYESSQDKEEFRRQKIEEYKESFLNPYVAAHAGYVDEVIEPAVTRRKIACILDNCLTNVNMDRKKRQVHGNIPL